MSERPKAYKIDTAAEAYSVSRDTIKRAIASGKLRAKRSGPNGKGHHLISADALEEWFQALSDA